MKLTTVLIFGVFTLGSTYALADHRHDHGYKHRGYGHHKTAQRHTAEAAYRKHYPQEHYARVVNVEPVYRYYQQPVSDHSCVQYDQGRAGYNSHTATVLGAVIGGALGHRIGDSHGDPKVAAVAGGLLGASIGRDMDRRVSYNRGLRVEGPCRVGHREETRRQLVEYKVSYRYNGQVHLARMDYDPGEWVKLDVNVKPA
jgi:uncharacterized protein YcfJ